MLARWIGLSLERSLDLTGRIGLKTFNNKLAK